MAPHSSTLAWKIPWMEEPGRLQSMGSQRVKHDWATSLSMGQRPFWLWYAHCNTFAMEVSVYVLRPLMCHALSWLTTLYLGSHVLFSRRLQSFWLCFHFIARDTSAQKICHLQSHDSNPRVPKLFFFLSWDIMDMYNCVSSKCTMYWFSIHISQYCCCGSIN